MSKRPRALIGDLEEQFYLTHMAQKGRIVSHDVSFASPKSGIGAMPILGETQRYSFLTVSSGYAANYFTFRQAGNDPNL